MRLNLFLPFWRRSKQTPVPGLLRQGLKRLGPTWRSSPVRRFVQTGCLGAFLWLFFYVCWPYGSRDYSAAMAGRARIPAATFLALDPLVSLSTTLAARAWVWSLWWALGILLACVLLPRGFCGYVCPLGTLIDLFDWTLGKRVTRFRVKHDGWWVNLKYFVLLGVLASSVCGVLLSGFVAAIPVLTRGLQFTLAPLQMGSLRGFYQVPARGWGEVLSVVLFLGVLGLGLMRPRFWCRYVCPTGAMFSAANLWRATERKVQDSCIHCNKCVKICPFDAIKGDFTTRTDNCTLCQTCGGVCPVHAIKFVDRWETSRLKEKGVPETHEIALSRRGVLLGVAAGIATAAGVRLSLASTGTESPLRPPGSVPEGDFQRLCIRCGACFEACPNNVLQPMGFVGGLDNLWTPQAVPTWSGCEPSCNNCGQVCPTGAIRALPIYEKRAARMGLAIINVATCLPHAGKEACQLCADECTSAGYNAIEFQRVGTQVDKDGEPVEGSGFTAPVVVAEKCVGCGLCQTRCQNTNVKSKGLLRQSAIIVHAGQGREDRVRHGSYVQLRVLRQNAKEQQTPAVRVPYPTDF